VPDLIRDFTRNLSSRERLVLGFGGLVVALIIGYAMLWHPWQQELSRLRQRVTQQKADLAWIQAQASVVKRVAASTTRPKNEAQTPLLTIIERTADSARLRDAIRSITPGEGGEVRLQTSEIPFDPWLRWMDTLRQRGVRVVAANITRAGEDRVTIRFTVARPG